jgi:hypothetical protein
MPAKQKISDKQFLDALYINNGDITDTARYIQRKHNISYSPQAVHERATTKFATELRSIYRLAANEARGRLMAMMADETCDVRLRAKVAIYLHSKINKYLKYEFV